MLKQAFIIFQKEIRSELRTRYVINSLLVFTGITIGIIRFAIGEEPVSTEVLAGILWVIIFFSAITGLARIFVKEEETETAYALKLSATPLAVFSGKLLYNMFLTIVLTFSAAILFSFFTGFIVKNIAGFALAAFLGVLGFSISLTLLAAIISKAGSKSTVYPILAFPVLIPFMLVVVEACKLTALGAQLSELSDELVVMICFIIVSFTASVMLFRFVWEE